MAKLRTGRSMWLLCVAGLLAGGCEGGAARVSTGGAAGAPACAPARAPVGVPMLDMSCIWPEQGLADDVIHKTRVPRGGTFDVVAVLDMNGAESRTAKVALAMPPGLTADKLFVDGKSVDKPAEAVTLDKPAGAREIRWRFELPWEVRKAQAAFAFEATASLGYRYAELKKSVSVQQGVSCYATTMKRRLEQLASSPHCKLDVIGKTVQGRDMYLLSVSDFAAPVDRKKQLILIGPYHGNEPSGVESILDFAFELVNDPANRRLLEGVVFYIIPCHNPDGREMAKRTNIHGVDFNNGYKPIQEPEALAVAAGLRKHKSEFTHAIGIMDHEWGRPWTLLSHLDELGDPARSHSWQVVRNASIRVTNETARIIVPSYSSNGYEKDSVRRFLREEIAVPNFTLENSGGGDYNIGTQMPNILTEMAIYYATAEQLLRLEPVKPKAHPAKAAAFAPEHVYKACKAATPPVIDGKLDDACWPGESIITGFVTAEPRGGRWDKLWDTTVHVVYDDKNLYVAFKMPDLKESTVTGYDPYPGIWTQDGCDMMFDTGLSQWSYFQFQANANGAFAGRYFVSPGIPDNGTFKVAGYRVAGSRETGVVEMSIPFAAFNNHPEMLDPAVGVPPPPGTTWGANFYRNGHDGKPAASWAPVPKDYGGHSPWAFRGLTFMGEKP